MNAPAGASATNHPRARRRTVLCTRGGLFGALVLRELSRSGRIEVCGIVRSSRMFDPALGVLRGSRAYIRRCGMAYALYLWCATTLADLLCALARIGCVPMRSAVRGVPVHITRNVNDAQALKFLADCAPDLLVSAYFDQRLQERALAVARDGCVNIHPSLLPMFKGVDPVLRARLAAAPAGVSVHYMTPALDSGPILAQQAVASRESDSIFKVTAQSFREGAALLVGVIDRVGRGQRGITQTTAGTYQSWPGRADIRALHARRGALIRLSDLAKIFAE